MSLELYRAGIEALNDLIEILDERYSGFNPSDLVQGDIDPEEEFTFNGETRALGKKLTFTFEGVEHFIDIASWHSHRHHDGEENPEYYYNAIDEDANSEFFIAVIGSWDSWGGSSFEDNEFKIAKKIIIEDFYMEEVT